MSGICNRPLRRMKIWQRRRSGWMRSWPDSNWPINKAGNGCGGCSVIRAAWRRQLGDMERLEGLEAELDFERQGLTEQQDRQAAEYLRQQTALDDRDRQLQEQAGAHRTSAALGRAKNSTAGPPHANGHRTIWPNGPPDWISGRQSSIRSNRPAMRAVVSGWQSGAQQQAHFTAQLQQLETERAEMESAHETFHRERAGLAAQRAREHRELDEAVAETGGADSRIANCPTVFGARPPCLDCRTILDAKRAVGSESSPRSATRGIGGGSQRLGAAPRDLDRRTIEPANSVG